MCQVIKSCFRLSRIPVSKWSQLWADLRVCQLCDGCLLFCLNSWSPPVLTIVIHHQQLSTMIVQPLRLCSFFLDNTGPREEHIVSGHQNAGLGPLSASLRCKRHFMVFLLPHLPLGDLLSIDQEVLGMCNVSLWGANHLHMLISRATHGWWQWWVSCSKWCARATACSQRAGLPWGGQAQIAKRSLSDYVPD